jgi:hypothetical protein
MKATELRLGNKIYYTKSWNKTDEKAVVSVCSDLIKEIEKNEKYGYSAIVEPIPLTEDILLKCGFYEVVFDSEQTGYGTEYHLKVNSFIYLNYADDFSLELYGSEHQNSHGAIPFWENTKTVHGLQNLYFALTGEELNVEL